MKTPSVSAFKTALSYTFAIATLIFVVIGLSGYFLFGATVDGNVLNSFTASSDNLMGVVTGCFLFVATSTIPVSNFVFRVSLHFMCFGEKKATEVQVRRTAVSTVYRPPMSLIPGSCSCDTLFNLVTRRATFVFRVLHVLDTN